MENNKNKSILWEAVKAISTLLIVVVVSIKIYTTPMSLTVDFPTLLSLLLALFSVALASLFYFKATDTSNKFYDNTYKFTGEISQILAKIESGFGERLKHLDEGYSSIRSSFQGTVQISDDEKIETTKQKLKEEKQEVQKVMQDRNRIVQDLIEKSQLETEQKRQIASQLKSKEEELLAMQQEVAKLNRRLAFENMRRQKNIDEIPIDAGLTHFTKSHIVEKIGQRKFFVLSDDKLNLQFKRLAKDLPNGYIEDLERLGLYDGNLTSSGIRFLRQIARQADTAE